MKKINKNQIYIILSLLFLATIIFFGRYFQDLTGENGGVGFQMENEVDRLDVEITESEVMGDALESEIEEYIEDDISELVVVDEEEAVTDNQDDAEAANGDDGQILATLPLPKRDRGADELRIGFMTDLHAKSNSGSSREERVIKPLFVERINHFIERMNNEFVPDFLLLNGDVIEGTGRDAVVGSGELSSLKKLFDRTLLPKYWVVGNHELRAVDKAQWKDSLGIDYLDKSFDIGNYRVIVLDSNFDENDDDIKPGEYFTRGKVSKRQIKWLEEAFKTDKKKIVFMHHPPLWNIDSRSNSGFPLNALEIRKVFRENGVMAVFSGHIEDFFYDRIDGVRYFVLPGVVKNEKYQGTYAEINIGGDRIELDVSYLKNDKYRRLNLKEILD
ncbi:MAG TPA: hypothetical protein DCX32_02680 [Candidatus Moranbacteria bacterium]|nr:MAG: hypothetical protein UW95_C0025G0007 [Parcubacteria group bacterium GW2011_GWC1_45_14]HAV11426.1 hypothetical protein [Candidatus Moranbacteria bacterium]